MKEIKQFRGTFNGQYSKMQSILFAENCYMQPKFLHGCHLQWNNYSKNLTLNYFTLLIFPALKKKKLALVGKIFWRFDIIFHLWLIHICSLNIPVMINILYKMIKLLHEKKLNAIYLYWFHNNTLTEYNSLYGHSNEPWINWKSSSYLLSSKIFLDYQKIKTKAWKETPIAVANIGQRQTHISLHFADQCDTWIMRKSGRSKMFQKTN